MELNTRLNKIKKNENTINSSFNNMFQPKERYA